MSEDDNRDKSSESESNAPLFFSAGPNESSVEAEETYSEDNNDDAKVSCAQLKKRWANSIHLYVEADDEDDCHVIYVIRRSGRSVEEKMTYSV